MSNIIEDVLYLILKELQYEYNYLHSCLLVNKVWCEISAPILWKNPWIVKKEKGKLLLNVIISHLSNETNEYLRVGSTREKNWQIPEILLVNFVDHYYIRCQ